MVDSTGKVGAKIIQGVGSNFSKQKIKLSRQNNKLPESLKPEISILTLTNDLSLKQIILTGYAIDGIQVCQIN